MTSVELARGDRLISRRVCWDLVRFAPRPPAAAHRVIRLGWPVYAWRVVVPKPFDQNLDPLERVVLRLAAAGKTQAAEIARLLSILPVLADQIQQHCHDAGWLKRDFTITENGRQILTSGTPPDNTSAVTDTGWIFRDAISGDVLPAFWRGSLPTAPRDARAEVTLLPFDAAHKSRPSAYSILAGLQLYSRVARHEPEVADPTGIHADWLDFEVDLFRDWDEGQLPDPSIEQVDKLAPRLVTVVTLRPETVDIEMVAFVTEDDPEHWLVRSPFGGAGGWWYKRKLEWAVEHSLALRDEVAGWVSRGTPALLQGNYAFKHEIGRDFPGLFTWKEGVEVLHELERAYQAEALYTDDPTIADLVLLRYQRVLEALLAACLTTISDRAALAKRVTGSGFAAKSRVMAAALDAILPPAFCRDSYGYKMAAVARYGGSALRDRALFLLAHAYYESDAPFRAALKVAPGLLVDIDLVTELRNQQSAHYSRNTELAPLSVVESVRAAAQRTLSVLVNCFSEEGHHACRE
jgi:hypothetical protein